MLHLEVVIVIVSAWTELDLFYFNYNLLLFRLMRSFLLFVKKLSKINNLANRRDCLRRHFNQIQVPLSCQIKRLLRRHQSQVVVLIVNDPDLFCANTVVYSDLRSARITTPSIPARKTCVNRSTSVFDYFVKAPIALISKRPLLLFVLKL